jgi:molybdenum cofactor cytidylyltransferase
MLVHKAELNLVRALRVAETTCLALVGAGGKTSAMFTLARQLPKPIFLTTTTHLAVEQARLAGRHIIWDAAAGWPLEEVPQEVLLFTGPAVAPDRLGGLQEEALEIVRREAARRQIPLLIEADGSRRLPLKAPAEYEPVIPDFADLVVVTAGMSGLDKPLDEATVHRPERFAALSQLAPGERVTAAALAKVLLHPQGGLKGIPARARRVVLLNQADTAPLQAQSHLLAEHLVKAYEAVVIASLAPGKDDALDRASRYDRSRVFAVMEPVAGVILAAGAAQRFKSPKQLLEWHGEAMVRHIARTALDAGLDPVLVVTGAHAAQVEAALQDLLPLERRLKVVHNPDWEQGQGTSVRVGTLALPPGCGAAIMLLVDQPQTPPSLLRALCEAHSTSLAAIIAPLVQGERANPVLFDRDVFADLTQLAGEEGGRVLFKRFPPIWLPWFDYRQALDIDTPEDYQRLLDIGD